MSLVFKAAFMNSPNSLDQTLVIGIQSNLQVESLKEFLERFGSRSSASPVVSHPVNWSTFLSQDVHVDELKASHFAIQHACPYAHGWLTDDINHVSNLRQQNL